MEAVHTPASAPFVHEAFVHLVSIIEATKPAVDPDKKALTTLCFTKIGSNVHLTPFISEIGFVILYISNMRLVFLKPVYIDKKLPNRIEF